MNLSVAPKATSAVARPTRTILWVALQSAVEVGQLAQFAAKNQIERWFYLGEDSAWRVGAERLIGPDVSRDSIAGLLGRKSWELRQPYIDWIGGLSRDNDSLEWWASGLADKNPFSRLFIRICLLASARQVISDGLDQPTLMVCSSPAMIDPLLRMAADSDVPARSVEFSKERRNIRHLAAAGRRYLRGPYRRIRSWTDRWNGRVAVDLDSDPAYRRRVLARHGVETDGDFSGDDTILAVTWVDGRSFDSSGSFQHPYLGILPRMLEETGYRVAYVPRVTPTVPFDEAVARLVKSGERIFFPDQFVSLDEYNACRDRAVGYLPAVPSDAELGDVPIFDLAMEQAAYDRKWLVDGLTIERMVANLSAQGVRPRQIIHPWEGHGWEQALAWSVRRHMKGTSVVGYDMGTFSPMVMSTYPSKYELDVRPLPDRVVTNGPLAQEALSTNGLPPDVVKSGCAMRFPELATQHEGPARLDRWADQDPVRMLVATSVVFGDSLDLVDKAAQAFGGHPDMDVVVKCHPMIDPVRIAHCLGRKSRFRNLSYSDRPLSSLLTSVQIVLYTYTTVCFDALRLGAAPVFVQAENRLNLDPLETAPEVRWVATSPEDLRRVVAEIVALSEEERVAWQERANEVLRRAFAPVTPECVDAFVI